MSLPVTVLAGPSTCLRDHLVRCLVLRRPSLVAVRYDVQPAADPHGDGLRLIRRTIDAAGSHHVEAVELTGCCLSCTVRVDAEQALALVAGADRWKEAVLALPAALAPSSVLGVLDGHPDFHVDTVTTVVDALLLRAQVGGDDLLGDRGLAAAPTDRRTTAELVLSQLEDADVLVIADLHRIATGTARTLQALLSHLAPLALQVPLGAGGVGSDEVVTTARHDRQTWPDARRRLADLALGSCPPACGITTVRWRSDRPLHGGRLAVALPELIDGVVRSYGVIWLADRPEHHIAWESAGATLSWGDPARWQGAASCELTFTGVDLDAVALLALLQDCLATPQEQAQATGTPDPFAHALGPRPTA